MSFNRLKAYILEANVHVERLKEILKALEELYPLSVDRYSNLSLAEKNLLDSLAFRFSKLQDLIGSKIFREYLKEVGFVTEGKTFLELLREIENEGIIDIDTWSDFRKMRNLIAHDYPEEVEKKVEAINYLTENAPILIEVVRKIESKAK